MGTVCAWHCRQRGGCWHTERRWDQHQHCTHVALWQGRDGCGHAEPFPSPGRGGPCLCPRPKALPRSPAVPAPSHRRVLFSQPALLSHPEIGTAEILQEMKKKKNQTQSSIKGELPLASVRCNWIRSLSDLPICGGVSSPGAAQSQSVRPGGAVCSSAGVPADRGDLAFID